MRFYPLRTVHRELGHLRFWIHPEPYGGRGGVASFYANGPAGSPNPASRPPSQIITGWMRRTRVLKACATWRVNQTLLVVFADFSAVFCLLLHVPVSGGRNFLWALQIFTGNCRKPFPRRPATGVFRPFGPECPGECPLRTLLDTFTPEPLGTLRGTLTGTPQFWRHFRGHSPAHSGPNNLSACFVLSFKGKGGNFTNCSETVCATYRVPLIGDFLRGCNGRGGGDSTPP